LPGRLPYKLRELGLSAYCGLEQIRKSKAPPDERQKAEKDLLDGLFRSCLDTPKAAGAPEAFVLWRQGIALYHQSFHNGPDFSPGHSDYADGLLFCREMGGGGSEAEGM
jgi:hypothetical protein